jgi:tyrosine-protein kinase Etk/Wzc
VTRDSEQDSGADGAERGDAISFVDVAIVLAKHKRTLFLAPIAVAVAAAIVVSLLPNIYSAKASIVPPQQPAGLSTALGQLGILAGAATSMTASSGDVLAGMLASQTIADRLIERFKLQQLFRTDTLVATRMELDARTNINFGRDGIITISFEDTDPRRAADVTNAYIEELTRTTQTIAVTEAARRRLFFEQQLKEVRGDLTQAEMTMRSTQERTGVIRPDEQGRATIEAVAALRAQVVAKEVQLAALETFATKQHPEYIRTRTELAGLKTQLNALQKGAGQSADVLVAPARAPELGLEYARAYRDVKYYETLFELLAKQFEIAKADEAREGPLVQILDRATPPDEKSKPKRTIIVLLAGLLTGIVAVIWVFAREAFERTSAAQPSKIEALKRHLRVRRK